MPDNPRSIRLPRGVEEEELAEGEPGSDRIERRRKRDETYSDARTRRERAAADKEEYERDMAKIQRDQLRGKLVTASEATAAAAQVRDSFLAAGKQLWSRTEVILGESGSAMDKKALAAALHQAWQEVVQGLSI